MNTGKILLGVIAGAAAGALAGILFAPAKGSKTRKRILKKGEAYSDAVKDKFNDLLEDVTEKFETMKEDITDFAEKKMGQTEETETKTKTAESKKS
jgi:gas vesicle protein